MTVDQRNLLSLEPPGTEPLGSSRVFTPVFYFKIPFSYSSSQNARKIPNAERERTRPADRGSPRAVMPDTTRPYPSGHPTKVLRPVDFSCRQSPPLAALKVNARPDPARPRPATVSVLP
jgi:hypothetical protein